MFGRWKKPVVSSYDKSGKIPVIRSSICNGEQVAGFKDIHTGKFTEVTVIRDSKDMDEFLETYEISADAIKKEW